MLDPESARQDLFGRPLAHRMVSGRPTEATESDNWSGLVTSAPGIEGAEGTWTVPSVGGAAGTASASWVGVDGVTNSDLIQTGTSQDPASGYSAWWEILPAPAVTIASPGGSPAPVSPGDQMVARVSEVRPGTWSIYLADRTAGWSFQQDFAYSGPGTSAEWIEEAPMIGGTQTSPADFGSVGFGRTGIYGDFAGQTGWFATDMSAADEVEMVDPAGHVLATASAPAASPGGGQEFTDTFVLPPGPPTALVATAGGAATAAGEGVELSWQPPGGDGGLPVESYIVEQLRASGSPVVVGSTSTPSAAITDLSPGATYGFEVTATNAGGWSSSPSSPVTVTLPPATSSPTTAAAALGPPGQPVASPTGPGEATVSWDPPSSPALGQGAIEGYFVTAHLLGGRGRTVFSRTTAVRIAGLPAGAFEFTATAVGPDGEGPPSEPSAPVEIADPPVEVSVTRPAPLNGPGTISIRVTTDRPGLKVVLYDEPFAATSFFPRATATTAATAAGDGTALIRVELSRTNRFYVVAGGVRSDVVTAKVS